METPGEKKDIASTNSIRRSWQAATLVKATMVADNVKSLTFSVPQWIRHEAGQHYDIRLTAPNGYQAERDYSVASAPEEEGVVEFGVQLLSDGEVSPYLFKLPIGGQVEIKGPVGGHFVWSVKMPGPLCLIGGGSGMVPLMSMLRHHERHLSEDTEREIIFLISARNINRVLYYDELSAIREKNPKLKVVMTITDIAPPDFKGYQRRIDTAMLSEVFSGVSGKMPMIYVCGPTPFVEVAAGELVSIGFNPHEIRTERFGG